MSIISIQTQVYTKKCYGFIWSQVFFEKDQFHTLSKALRAEWAREDISDYQLSPWYNHGSLCSCKTRHASSASLASINIVTSCGQVVLVTWNYQYHHSIRCEILPYMVVQLFSKLKFCKNFEFLCPLIWFWEFLLTPQSSRRVILVEYFKSK